MAVFASSSKGQFRKSALNHPLAIMAGDVVDRIGNQVVVTRNGIVTGTATIGATSVPLNIAAEHAMSVSEFVYFQETPVAGQSIVLTRITENQNTGVVTFFYSNGSSSEYPSWSEVGSTLGELDQQPTLAEKILAYKSYVNSPDGTNKTTMLDVNCTINFEAATPIALIEG